MLFKYSPITDNRLDPNDQDPKHGTIHSSISQ